MLTIRPSTTDSRSLQSFVFDSEPDILNEHEDVCFTNGTVLKRAQAISHIAGLLMGCSHEFRDGPNANYKAHLYSLNGRGAVLEFVRDNFGFARPNNPFISLGRFVDFCDLESITHRANPDKKGRTICCNYWQSLQDKDDEIIEFYAKWVARIKENLTERGVYDRESFMSGLLHSLPRTTPDKHNERDNYGSRRYEEFSVLAVQAAVKAEYGAVCNRASHAEDISGQDLTVIYPSDNRSERVQVKSHVDSREQFDSPGEKYFKVTVAAIGSNRIPTVFTSSSSKWAFYLPLYDPANVYIFEADHMKKFLKFHYGEKINEGLKGGVRNPMIAAAEEVIYWRSRSDGVYDGYAYISVDEIGRAEEMGRVEKLPIPKACL